MFLTLTCSKDKSICLERAEKPHVDPSGAHTGKTHSLYLPICDSAYNEETQEFWAQHPPVEQTNPLKGRFSSNIILE